MSTLSNQYEQLAPITKFGIALALIATIAWYSWDEFITPKQATLTIKQEELNTITNELKDANTLISPVSMEEELNKANREYKKMIELLPDEPAIEKILNDFASLSRLTGVEIREFMPVTSTSAGGIPGAAGMTSGTPGTMTYNAPYAGAAPMPAPGVDEDTNSITITLKLQGTFSSMVSFMDMAMSLPRVIRIQDFEILHEDRELKLVQRPKLSFTGKFTAYFQRNLNSNKAAETDAKDKTKAAVENTAPKPLIDINAAIDTSFSAKGSAGP